MWMGKTNGSSDEKCDDDIFIILLAGIPGFARDSCIFSRRILATAGQNPVVPIASLHPYFLPHPSGVKGEH